MGKRLSAAAPEKNPGPRARQSAVRGEDLFYISMCSGGAIIKISKLYPFDSQSPTNQNMIAE